MNLKVLKRSRKVQVGDVFAYQLIQEPERYRFGRVVCTTACSMYDDRESVLIYLYKAWSHSMEDIPKLSPDDLLVDPIITNKRPWTMGYLATVAHRDLTPDDTLAHHYFIDVFQKKVYDECGNEVADPVLPIYPRMLTSFMGISERISDELGYPVDETAYRDRD